MIKKTIMIASMVILSAALMWAVWEGNAAAGSSEDFPAGLFASSDLFPKYTLIEITNLEKNTTSRAVIIDNKGAQGVLVKVSPDLAKVLEIQEGSTARVRVSIPPLVAEEGADPVLLGKLEPKKAASTTATPAQPPDAEPAQPEPVPEEPAAPIAEVTEPVQPEPAQPEPVPEEPAAPIAEVTELAQPEPVPEEPVAPIAEVTEPVKPEPVPEEPAAPIAEVAEPAQPEPVPEEPAAPIAEVTEPVKPEPVPEEPMAPIAEVTEPVKPEPEILPAPAAVPEVTEPVYFSTVSESSAEAKKTVPNAPAMQKPPQERLEYSDEYTKQVPQVAEITVPDKKREQELNKLLSPVPEVSTPIAPEPVVAETSEETAEPREEPTDEPEIVAAEPHEEQPEEPVVEPELPAVEPNEKQTEETRELQDEPEVFIAEETLAEKGQDDNTAEDDLITEKHIMLVPSEPREPVKEYIPVPKEPEKPALSIAPVVTPPAEPVVAQAAEESYTANVLTKGATYVQIGWFKDILNVESFVQRYGKQYPIAVEKSSTTSEVFYKVYIGPLKKDEQGAALETFQKLGFKDAFLKKAP